MDASITKGVLGSADYTARWIGQSHDVQLVARGVVPGLNAQAWLEMRPEMIVPPMWNLLFYVPDYGLWQAKPFVIEVSVDNCAGNGNLTVVDAIGESEAASTYVNA